MDIENMHPFCLPFGFCHDATSSSIATDFAASVHQTSGISDSNINNNNNDENILKSHVIRSKTSSPTDELFRHLTTTSHSLLHDESIIIGSISPHFDLNDDDAFYSLDLDSRFEDEFKDARKGDDGGDELKDSNSDDWYSDQYSSLFSPNGATTKTPTTTSTNQNHHQTKRRKSLNSGKNNSNAANNQVFHHAVVDPIDIKSSPTLAQLNLNSNDDPADGLWDSTTITLASANNGSSLSSANLDLLSNCTSINGVNRLDHHHHHSSLCNSNVTCNHLNHQHTQNHHHHLATQPYSAHLANSTPSCHHIHHHHHYRSRYSSGQSTCLAVTPFRKQTDSSQFQSTCCHDQNQLDNVCGSLSSSGHNLKPSATLNQLNQKLIQHNDGSTNRPTFHNDKQQQHKSGVQPRSSSPALVTSSSSPLSSSTASSECRSSDNKLKENIEYLTALLCNGNKLENNNQQPTINNQNISSSMVKSYTTLAHSLSTGPKLLERQPQPQHQQPAVFNNVVVPSQQGHLSMGMSCPNNEAAPFIDANMAIMQQANSIKRPCHSSHWFKPAVETSVSPADSTESNQVTSISGANVIRCPVQQIQHHQPAPLNCQHNQQQSLDQRQRPVSELKVLSSLLNGGSSKCSTTCTGAHVYGRTCWQGPNHHQISDDSPLVRASPMTGPTQVEAQEISIPVHGKPITLTPLNANNNIIIQQYPMKPKPTVFAQPASPSASSTASSGGNAEPPSSTMTNMPSFKRQRASNLPNQSVATNKTSNRLARPNSLSTDCSLSSHDEGFSSQVDNDDCNSGRDSDDDDDDVDSDDESFYGDYTNSDLIGASISDNAENKWTLNMGRTRRNGQKRFFWQYNVQSKGPKGTRISSADNPDDPFVLPEASDPVFSNDCQVEGVKHSGKARRGDGNDLTPNPRKLLMIGLELKKLGKIINELAPVTDLPLNARNKTRKEKNKLASRACRLKKKAQHEANKIKLYGLQREHQQVVLAIFDARKLMNETIMSQKIEPCTHSTESSVKIIAENCSMVVAGQTSDYVNSVLEKVVSGCIDGGLQT